MTTYKQNEINMTIERATETAKMIKAYYIVVADMNPYADKWIHTAYVEDTAEVVRYIEMARKEYGFEAKIYTNCMM